MAAGETGGRYVHGEGDQVGARAVEVVFEDGAGEKAANDRAADEQRHVLLAVEREEDADAEGQER